MYAYVCTSEHTNVYVQTIHEYQHNKPGFSRCLKLAALVCCALCDKSYLLLSMEYNLITAAM